MSNSSWPHGLQHARLPCPSPTPRACSNSCPLSQWCHPTISSFVLPVRSCLQSFLLVGEKKKPTSITSVHKLIIFNVILKDKPLKECLMELDFFLLFIVIIIFHLIPFILSPWNIQSLLRFYSTVFSLNPYPAHFKDPFCESAPPFPMYLEFSTSSVRIFFNWALRLHSELLHENLN